MAETGYLGSSLDKHLIGQRCRTARKRAVMTQKEVAEALGYKSPAVIANKEKGLAYPSVVDVYFLSFRSGLSIEWILSGNETKKLRGDPFAVAEVLSANEAVLITQYRLLSEQKQARLAYFLMSLMGEAGEESAE